MKIKDKSYKLLMIRFNILASLNRCLLEENMPDNELQTFLKTIESECVKKIPNNDTVNFFLPRINKFLNKYRNSLHTKAYHHLKNLRSYELFFPEDIVKEMQNAKQRKNNLLLGRKKDIHVLNKLNKINLSNKMDKNKKTHKRSNVCANMNISAKKANKTSEKMVNPLLEFSISAKEANERLQPEDKEDSFEDILPESLGITAEDMTLEESDKTSEKMFNPLDVFKISEEANKKLQHENEEDSFEDILPESLGITAEDMTLEESDKTSEKMFNPLDVFNISEEEANKWSTDIKYVVPECKKEDRFRYLYNEKNNKIVSNAQNKYNQVCKKKYRSHQDVIKNKINLSNKMNENKKNSNHIKEQKHKRANAYINLDNYMLGKSNDNKILS